MDTYSIVIVVGFVVSLLLGYLLGFGKVLKFITGGIVGIIISIVICAMFGGIIANISPVAALIEQGHEYFGGVAAFLATIRIELWIYYVVLFVIIQILRIIIVKTIGKIFEPKDKDSKLYGARNVVNRVLGLITLGVSFLFLVYLVMAVLALLTDVESVSTFLSSLKEKSLFLLLYNNNPINLAALFGMAVAA